MKIKFENSNSFIEFKNGSPGKIVISLAAEDKDNSLKLQINTSEITIQELSNLVHSLGVSLVPFKE